jgi:drug/metabolite transporter (DMT)-like permease
MPCISPSTSRPGTSRANTSRNSALTRSVARTAVLTCIALLCFSANSILCRLALAPKLIDPASFTTVRILSAAVMLTASVWLKYRHFPGLGRAKARSVAAVFVYLVFFSFAYTRLGAATGALVLIAAVQFTMLCIALFQGERFALLSWAGFALAVGAVLWLLLPGATAPDLPGAALMAVSGAAWGFFTVFARGADHPEETNASNMLWCLPSALFMNLLWLDGTHWTATGLALATASGAVATGFGYIVWYLALRNLLVTQATTVQLSMPAVVALAGVVFLAEPLTARLLVASAAMLGGIGLALIRRPVSRERPRRGP